MRRFRVPVFAKIDFRWSCTVCSERNRGLGDRSGVGAFGEQIDELAFARCEPVGLRVQRAAVTR